MNKPRFSAFFLLLTALVPGTIQARQIAVYPPAGSSGPISIYTADLQYAGYITGPPAPVAVLTVPAGGKYYVLSQSATGTLTIATSLAGTAAVRDFGEAAQAGAVTPDGQKLIVLTSNVRIFSTFSDLEIAAPIYAGSLPNDVGVSPDSRYAYVLSSGSASVALIDLATTTIISTQAAPSNASALTVAPNGTVYVSGEGRLSIYDGRTLNPIGQIQTTGRVGRLNITPDGRYGLAPNLTVNTSSAYVFDLPARGVTASVSLASGDGTLALVDRIEAVSNSQAVAVSSSSGKMYTVTVPQGGVSDFVPPGYGTIGAASGQAVSSELPNARNIYFVNGRNLSRYDLLSGAVTGGIPQNYPGVLTRLGDTPAGAVSRFQLDSDGAVVPPSSNFLLVARALDSDGQPVRNAFVTFSSNNAGVYFLTTPSPASVGGGFATVQVQAPSSLGPFQITVSSGSVTQTFTLNAGTSGGGGGSGAASGLVKIQGDGQLSFSPFSAPLPLIVEARDTAGKPVWGVPVTWSGSGDVALGSSYTFTDEKGQASITVFLTAVIPPGNGFNRSYVSASTASGTVTFSLVGIPYGVAAPSILLLKPETGVGTKITAKAGVKLVDAVRIGVATAAGVPVPGVGLSLSTGNDPAVGPVAACDGGTVLTGDTGLASCDLIASGKPGTATLTVNAGGAYTFSLQLEVLPGDPSKIQILQGDGQSGAPNTLLGSSLAGKVLDSLGNALAGTAVTWTVSPAGSATLVLADQVTDSSGKATTQVRLGSVGGAIQITMRAGNATATFSETITIPVGALLKVSGDNQASVVTGQPFPSPLVVQVNNTSGQPVAGVSVSWQVTSGSASLSGASSTTDAAGRTQASVTAGATAGPIVVTASVTGVTAVTFNLTSRLPGPIIDSSSFAVLYANTGGLVAGSYSILTGKGLAPNISGTMYANSLSASLPTSLGGVRIQIGGDPNNLAPIYAVSNVGGVEAVVFITPFDTLPGVVNVTVKVGDSSTTASSVPVRSYAPAFMETTDGAGNRVPLAIRSDGNLVSSSYPARRGETLTLYAIGLGQTNPQARTNVLGGFGQTITAPMAVAFGSAAITLPAELSRQFISVYEINVVVPNNADLGPAVPLGLQIVPPGSGPLYGQDDLTVPIIAQ